VPSELSEVLQSIIIFFVAAEIGITMFFRWRKNQKVQVEEFLKMGILDEGVSMPSDQSSSFSDGEE
jgi:divalent metal cation (Fe/Co/Zn/Cd) transporter